MIVEHEIIRASAGTGKTFALSDRIVRLLALGAPPETIVALTFTRKAAAEFVSAVFRKLADAALDESVARDLSARLRVGALTAADFSGTLARVTATMTRLQFGTLDSFFQRAAGAIPFELGLSGPIQILDEVAAAEARLDSLERLVRESVDETPRRALLDAFRAATWGADEKLLFQRLLRFLDSGHDLYLEARAPHMWGQGEAIWPRGNPLIPPPADISEDIACARAFAESCENSRFASALRKFAAQAAAWQPGLDLPDGSVADQLFAELGGADVREPLELVYYRKTCVIPGTVVTHFQRIVRHCLGSALAQSLRAARGMHHLIAGYDRIYEGAIRRTGRLAFADITELLRRVDPFTWQPRLDSRISHWLFDEFQDTSLAQWAVLEGLVDEALQDPSGARSVFFVGDPKQAIYRWRGGEHRLLSRIANRYEKAIRVIPLDRSFRSAPAVIDLVNLVGDAACRSGDRLPAAAIEEWRAAWSSHASAVAASRGFVRVREVDAKDREALHDSLLASLREVDPIARGLTCAILTRGNDEAAEIAHALRQRGFLDVAAETDVSVATDQPLTLSLLALVSAVAHPGDIASRRIVEMSPLAPCAAEGWDALGRRVLHSITTSGFEATIQSVISETPESHPTGRFGALRLAQLLEIARACDAGDVRGPDDFVRRAREAFRRETASAGRVQVMTIHKAKGLGFDFVLLPLLRNRRMDAVESDLLLVSRDDARAPRWIIGRPPAAVIESDNALSEAQERRRADAAYESLCVLYVALTRARFGLHIFTGPPPASSDALSAADLLRRAIANSTPSVAGIWQHGDAAWFEAPLREIPSAPRSISRADWTAMPAAPRDVATLPSRRGDGDPPALEAARFGAEVHSAFAALEWLEDMPAPADSPSTNVVAACLSTPEIAALFRRPHARATVWRERAFDIVLEGRWISGVFDRVVLCPDSATLVEFKTDRIDPDAARARHSPQIGLYHSALASLTGLQHIRAVLVLTHSRQAIEL